MRQYGLATDTGPGGALDQIRSLFRHHQPAGVDVGRDKIGHGRGIDDARPFDTPRATQLVNQVYLRVSQINGCAYCSNMHSRDLLKGGLGVEKLVLVPAWREAGSLFDSRERAALAWAETVTRVADTAIPDGEFESASAAFSEKELADLTIAIGLMNAYNRLAIGFRNPPKAAT